MKAPCQPSLALAARKGWVGARPDPVAAISSLTPGSSLPQAWEHLADRNLDLIRRYADVFATSAETGIPHA